MVALLTALAGLALAVLVAVPHSADAKCKVTVSGQVNCDANTKTTNTTNPNGAHSSSSARQQSFNNGSDIIAKVRSGVRLTGSGLQLTSGGPIAHAVVAHDQGLITTSIAPSALELDGNGGTLRYSGKGSIINIGPTGSALSATNTKSGNVFISTGAGAITGPTGISAATTGIGELNITTGSGLVTGTNGEGITAKTENGPLNLTIGSGGVKSDGNQPAVRLKTTNGDIKVTADGNVSATGATENPGSVNILSMVSRLRPTVRAT